MRAVHVAVPLAAAAAVLTRWPDTAWGLVATALAGLWVYAAHRAEADGRLHLVGPVAALGLVALPVDPAPLLPLPGIVVGLAVGIALLTALPVRQAGIAARFRLGSWTPTILIAMLLLVPLALPLLVGTERLAAAADRLAPATTTAVLLLVTAAVAAYVLLTPKEVAA